MVFDRKFKIYYEIDDNKNEVYILKFAMSSQDDSDFF